MPTEILLESLRGLATCSIPEAAEILGIGRDAAYTAAHRWIETGGSEGLPVLRGFGRALRVPVPRLLDLIGADTQGSSVEAPRVVESGTDRT